MFLHLCEPGCSVDRRLVSKLNRTQRIAFSSLSKGDKITLDIFPPRSVASAESGFGSAPASCVDTHVISKLRGMASGYVPRLSGVSGWYLSYR